MKKALLLLLMLPAMLMAAPVEPNLAQQVAENFINAPESGTNNAVQQAPRKPKRMRRTAKQVTSDQQFYVFNSEDGNGFVIVSADDVVRPILGYSDSNIFDVNNVPDGVRFFLDNYNQQIKYAQENNLTQSNEIREKWEAMRNNNGTQATTIVAPLITTKWGQAPLYNSLCPIVSVVVSKNFLQTTYMREQAVTGCAATALAQVMNYWEWPQRGSGSHQYNSTLAGTQYCNFGATEYDWGNMPDSLTPNSNTNQIKAVATLMYHCGVSMDMNYGFVAFGGSGIDTISQVENAVKSFFRYSESTTSIDKSQYTDAEWISTLKSQLDAQHPMVYIGIGKGGHAFVCDGYRSDNYFHFNWGWSGGSDGYYPVDSLMPSTNGIGSGGKDYTARQYALINMVPKEQPLNLANLQIESEMSLDQSSIVYGGTTAIYATIKNSGSANFTGDISALVIDTMGNYITEIPIKTNYTIPKNSTLLVAKSIVQNALLVPGRYAIALVYNSEETGYQLVGSEYYTNGVLLDVSLSAPIEKKSDFEIYSDCNNELTTAHQIWFRVTFGNTSSSTFTGRIALALYDPETLQLAQLVSEISFALTGIGANEERTVNFIDTIRLEPKSYLAALVYSTDNSTYNFVGSTYSQNPCMVRVIKDPAEVDDETGEETDDFELKPGKYVVVANRAKEGDRNWYYMTSDLGTASTKRFQAVSTETESIDAIDITDLEDKFVWTLEADGSNWKLKNGTQYVTWTSGNSANLGTTAKTMTFDVADNQVLAHFNDGTAERYLSLNATTNNNYFAFYSGTNQVEQLFFLPYDEGTTPIVPPIESNRYIVLAQRNATSNWLYMTSDLGTASNKRYQAVDAGTSVLANVVNQNLADKFYWEIDGNKLKTAAGYSTWTSGNSANLDATGKDLTIQQQTDGTYTFSFIEGDNTRYLALNKTVGNDYFAYYNGTNQIYKLTLVKEGYRGTTTSIEGVSPEEVKASKILRDGQIFILRGDKTYTLQGQEVK